MGRMAWRMEAISGSIAPVLLTASLSANVYLGWRLRTNAPHRTLAPHELALGTHLPIIRGADARGLPLTIDWSDPRPTVLYVFTPKCPWCKRNLDAIKALIAARQDKYRFIGITLSEAGLEEYLSSSRLGLPVCKKVDSEVARTLGLNATPETILVSPSGTVMRVWKGAFLRRTRSDIEQTFGVRLPVVEVHPG